MRAIHLAAFAALSTCLALASACAHGPIPPQAREGFFTCPASTLADAEANLVQAGFPIQAKSEKYVQTGYVQLYETGAAAMVFLGSRGTVSYRITAAPKGPDVSWNAWQTSSSQAVGLTMGALVASNAVVSEQPFEPDVRWVADDTSRGIMNRLRRSVCGPGVDYFTGEEEWAKVKRSRKKKGAKGADAPPPEDQPIEPAPPPVDVSPVPTSTAA